MVNAAKISVLMATVAVAAFARQIDVATMPESPFADAEISTNVVLHLARRDTRKLDVHIQLDGTETNNLDVAFGRDVNTNRILEAEEIDAVYGWRRGRYFIENLRDWASLETVADTNAPCCAFDIHMEMTPEIVLKRFAATCGGELSFPEIATNAPPAWLFNPEWDMVRVVRRGTGGASECVQCLVDYEKFSIHVR